MCLCRLFYESYRRFYEENISPNTSLAFCSFRVNHFLDLLLGSHVGFENEVMELVRHELYYVKR